MSPTIAIIPGFWEGPQCFENVSLLLSRKGYHTMAWELASTGTTSPGNPSMRDDIAGIRSFVEALVAAEKDIVMVLHSGGGFLGSNAIEGLTAKARKQKGLKGGVIGIVFLTAAVFPEGFKHGPLPFTESKDGAQLCIDPKKSLLNDLEPAVAEEWLGRLKPQPAEGWDDTVTYCGWRDVASVYLVCEGDQVIPPPLQVQLAETAGSKIEKCDAGHMVMLAMPEKVVSVIETAVTAFGDV